MVKKSRLEKDSELLSTGAAARQLGVSESLVRRLADTGRLPAVRLASGLRVYTRSEVERLRATRPERGAA